MKTIREAKARWDTETNPGNPGWVVDVVHIDGREETYPPPYPVYDAPQSEDPNLIVAALLRWECFKVG